MHVIHYITVFGYNKDDEYFYIIEANYIDSIIYEKRQLSFSDLKNYYYGGLDLLKSEDNQTYKEVYKIKNNEFDDKYYISKYIEKISLLKDSILSSIYLVDDYLRHITCFLENKKLLLSRIF